MLGPGFPQLLQTEGFICPTASIIAQLLSCARLGRNFEPGSAVYLGAIPHGSSELRRTRFDPRKVCAAIKFGRSNLPGLGNSGSPRGAEL